MTDDSGRIATTYFHSWKDKDFATLRSVLADDATFRGPLGTADDAETCRRGLRGMAQVVTDMDIHHVFVDGADVLTWFDLHTTSDLHTTVAPPAPTANWSQIENGKITSIRVAFDPRAFTARSGT